MKMNLSKSFFFLLSLVCLSFFYSLYSNVKLEVNFPGGKNCAAYKTNKSMIFQESVDVVGLNCDIAVTKKNENGKIILVANIPLEKFDSGEKGRDKYVFNYLNGKIRPSMIFTSKPYSGAEFQNIINGSNKSLSGFLLIGEKTYPIQFQLSKKGMNLTGKTVTTFTFFKFKPPRVGPFALVAKVQDYLELHFKLNLESI